MPALLTVLLIGTLAFGAFFSLTFFVIRAVTRRHRCAPLRLPNDGRTAERARRLQEESDRYRNLLAEQLIYHPHHEKGRRR